MNKLDITSLQKAIIQLKKGLERSLKNPDDEELRDTVIHRFEYNYELSSKLLKRYLMDTSASPTEIRQMAFPTLIRTGWEKGILKSSWDIWYMFRDARNKTSHGYDEKQAKEVYAIIPAFFEEISHFYNELNKRLA